MHNFSKELTETIAALYSGEAMKGDPTEVRITGHHVWVAQQAKKEQAAGESAQLSISDRLADCRSHLFDAKSTLNLLRKREFLGALFGHECLDIVVDALVDQAWNLVASASYDCEAANDFSDSDLREELQAPAMKVEEVNSPLHCLCLVGEFNTHGESLLVAFLGCLNQAQEGAGAL